MNRPSKDIDIVVSNNGINGGIDLAYLLHKKFNTSTPVVFKRFGTAQLVLNGQEIEFVATRKESYNFEDRNPEVSFGTIEDDVKRRDFTINALLYDISNEKIIDLIGGIFDIKNKIIRTTSNPKVIFAEDPLRIFRAIRFSAQLGFAIDTKTMLAIKEYVPWLKNISNERIRDELNKILISDHAIDGLWYMKTTGILEYLIPEFKELYKIKNQGKYHTKDLWRHTLEVINNSTPTVEHRLAGLLHDIGKIKTMTVDGNNVHFYKHQFVSQRIAHRFLTKYKYTNTQVEWITNSIMMHMNFVDKILEKTIRKMVNKYGKEQFLFFTDLGLADSKRAERRKIVEDIIYFVKNDDFVQEVQIKLPIDGNMIMSRYGLKPSKRVGELLTIEKEYLFEFPEATEDELYHKLDIEMVDSNGNLTIYQYIKPEKPAEFISIDF